jgi:hypothetical protein
VRSTPDNWEPMEDSDVDDWARMPLTELSRPEDVLVHEVWTLAVEVQQLRSVNNKAAEEIERLRAAGNALVFALENNLMATAVVLVNQWKEARREQ